MHGLRQRRAAREVRSERANRGRQAWLRVVLGDAGAVPMHAVSRPGGGGRGSDVGTGADADAQGAAASRLGVLGSRLCQR